MMYLAIFMNKSNTVYNVLHNNYSETNPISDENLYSSVLNQEIYQIFKKKIYRFNPANRQF